MELDKPSAYNVKFVTFPQKKRKMENKHLKIHEILNIMSRKLPTYSNSEKLYVTFPDIFAQKSLIGKSKAKADFGLAGIKIKRRQETTVYNFDGLIFPSITIFQFVCLIVSYPAKKDVVDASIPLLLA